jgi:Uma2 family endonuclease
MSRVSAAHTRFTVPEFERMLDADLFGTERVELINGRVYRMPPQNDPHQFGISKVARAFFKRVPENESIFTPGTLRLDAFTVVDSDVLWVAAPIGTPEHARPKPLVLVEVSHATYKRDSGIKLREYARYGIRDYWILHLKKERIEVYRNPQNPTGQLDDCSFASVEKFVKGQAIALLDRPEAMFRVDDLLP